MSLEIPSNPAPTGFYDRPAEYTTALDNARTLFEKEIAAGDWEDLGETDGVQLARKPNPDNPGDVPLVRGTSLIEGATPYQVLATIQLPGMRRKWDPRLEEAYPIKRFSHESYQFYTVMKSPSYFIWARDIVGVQDNTASADGSEVTILQTSVEDEDLLPDAGSYAKSRTRATVELSGWKLTKKGDDTEATYIVKVLLNGNIPTAVVSMIANETPMCVARVRDTFYTKGYAPYERTPATGGTKAKTLNQTQEFDDGDGSEASEGEKKYTTFYRGTGADEFEIVFDTKRMYTSGVDVAVAGEGASDVKTSVDNAAGIVKVEVAESAKDKDFTITLTPA